MINRSSGRTLSVCYLLPLVFTGIASAGDFTIQPTWQPVNTESVRVRLEEYLQSANAAPDVQAAIRAQWQASTGQSSAELLDRLAESLAKVDARVAELVNFCATTHERGQKLPEFAWLADSDTPQLVRNNMRVYLARWLVQQGYYDEAISWTDGLRAEEVVAPESLLFYRAVAHHQLVQADKADTAIGQLLEGQDKLPTRYQKLADLMRHDMEGLKDDSLDHISRRMEDVRRRLAQGRPGERVQGVEKGVIDSLDKLIKKAEDQAQQQSKMAAGSAKTPPSTP